MNKKNKLFALSFLLAAMGLLGACGPGKKEQEEQAQTVHQENILDTPTVALVPVKKGKLTSDITVPGELQPFLQVSLYAKINSYVKTLLVDIGSQVHKGQLLATLEAPEINSQLAQAKSVIQQNKAVYYASKATYDRLYNTSKTPGTISQNDLEQAIAKMRSDSANVEAAKSAYNVVAANVAYLQVRAPFDGIVTVRNVNPGTYVGPSGGGGNQPMFVIEDHKHLRLVISVPENFTGGLSTKDEVTFRVKALQGEKFTARIKRLAGSLDQKLRSERIEMDVLNQDNKLLPNMYADVNVPLPSQDSTFIVPKSSVVTSTEKVFVIKIADGRAQWVDVQKGREAGDSIEVYGNIKPGEQLVSAATEEIRDGSPIRIDSKKATESGPDGK
jgi:RND family efflux transporter MFP subunit